MRVKAEHKRSWEADWSRTYKDNLQLYFTEPQILLKWKTRIATAKKTKLA